MDTEEAVTAAAPQRVYVEPFVLVASSCSAIAARLCTHPLDTLRIRIQTARHPVPPLRELVPKPRLKSLYSASKRYFSEQWLPRDAEPTMLQQLPVFIAAGTAAEFASGAIWTPLDVLKSRLQTGREGTSGIALTRKILREEGVRGLMKGYWLGNLIFVPNISVYWCIYETLKQRFIPNYSAYRPASPPRDSPSARPAPDSPSSDAFSGIPVTLRYTLCSVAACSVAATATTPIEVVQARWQTSGASGGAQGGIRQIVRELWRQGGAMAFTKGLSFRIAYAIPANGISMTVYESVKRWKGIS
ncbi:hypothetical protein Rhopal_002527-T1 [Rhodotorula paludigena]|uniref:Mitochondrial carrier n=1 Tax=Rhodotorula paludigena TaxID=86838 RepID=A0AAV5GAG2_9BASI|nr:hypothetical protein Rhopal_002527-T1 [Rhodotorula paludigena]